MFNTGDVLIKENYTQGAIWCNENNATIEKQGGQYVIVAIPEPSLEQVKAEKKAEINRMRDAVEQGGFEYKGKVFDSDEISCIRMTCAAQAMATVQVTEGEPEPTIAWTCQDNSTIDLTPAELMELVSALAQWSNRCHEKATMLKAEVEAAKTARELESIKWEDSQDEETDLSGAEQA